MTAPREYEHTFTATPICPYCGTDYEPDFNDGDGYLVSLWGGFGSDNTNEVECKNEDCGRMYTVVEHVKREFSTRRLGE